MSVPAFTVERAAPPPGDTGGQGKKSLLRKNLEALKPGEVLRWSGDTVKKYKMNTTIVKVRRDQPLKTYQVRKVNGGYDIYCVEDMAAS